MNASSNTTSPPLTYVPGEPAGVGVDLAVELAHSELRGEVVVIGCRRVIEERAKALDRSIDPVEFLDGVELGDLSCGSIRIVNRPCPAPPAPGKPDTANAPWLLENLDRAWKGIQQGEFAALVTGPIDKSVVMRAGIEFSGHTEYLAKIDGDRCAVMLLAADSVKVALVTTHVPIAGVAQALREKIESGDFARIVRAVVAGLRDRYGIARPRLAVCGVNPHAGEHGQLGGEEVELMNPALESLRGELGDSAELVGPVAADTAFTPPHLERYDAHLCIYHDQGLTPIKSLAFGKIVNTTLGLSFVRTSVDHGVAYDRAGTGRASPDSLYLAISEAQRMAQTLASKNADRRSA